MIDVKFLQKIILNLILIDSLQIDKKKLQVKVESGILLTKLNSVLEENDMALSVLGAISDQTIAGNYIFIKPLDS